MRRPWQWKSFAVFFNAHILTEYMYINIIIFETIHIRISYKYKYKARASHKHTECARSIAQIMHMCILSRGCLHTRACILYMYTHVHIYTHIHTRHDELFAQAHFWSCAHAFIRSELSRFYRVQCWTAVDLLLCLSRTLSLAVFFAHMCDKHTKYKIGLWESAVYIY